MLNDAHQQLLIVPTALALNAALQAGPVSLQVRVSNLLEQWTSLYTHESVHQSYCCSSHSNSPTRILSRSLLFSLSLSLSLSNTHTRNRNSRRNRTVEQMILITSRSAVPAPSHALNNAFAKYSGRGSTEQRERERTKYYATKIKAEAKGGVHKKR